VIRWCIDEGNSLIAWAKKSRRIHPKSGIVKVNFGSSLVVTDGWINVDGGIHVLFAGWPRPFLKLLYRISDARNWWGDPETYLRQLKSHVFVHHNLEYGLPFSDNSVDFVYSSHVLEHFYPSTANLVLLDVHRVMRSGARLRICVPDLQHAFRLYAEGDKEHALHYFFANGSGELNRHRHMYDFDMLAALLGRAGFKSIQRCAYQQGLVPDLDRLDNRPEETLYVECVK
jgi:SAM-dependent methyltransferase